MRNEKRTVIAKAGRKIKLADINTGDEAEVMPEQGNMKALKVKG
jgi:hypothetical protein